MALETCIATIARSMNKIDVSKYTVVDAGNIMMDARYLLIIIDKFAGAKHLVDEMKLVHPKGK